MNYVAETQSEKTEENEETSESYEDYEDDAMENYEGFFNEEGVSYIDVSPYTCSPPRVSSLLQAKVNLSRTDSAEKRRLRRKKLFTVTGKKPENIPIVKRQLVEEVDASVFFGDRRPAEKAKKMREKWLSQVQKMKAMVPNFGWSKREILLPVLCGGVLCIRFDPLGESMTTAYRNGGVEIRKPFTGEVLRTLKTEEQKTKLPIRSVRYHPLNNKILYIGGGCGLIQIYNIKSSKSLGQSTSIASQINCLDINSDGYNLIIGGRKGLVGIYDTETLEVKSVREFPQQDETTRAEVEDEYHKMKVYGLKCHPTDPNVFVTGSWDCTVKVWDVRVQGAIKSMRGPMIYGDGVDLVENKIVTASWRAENSLSLWDLPSGQLIKNIPIKTKTTTFEGEFLYVVKFFNSASDSLLANGKCIAVGGSGFSSMLVINTQTERAIASFPSYKATLSLDMLGNVVAYGGKESVLRIGEVIVTESNPVKML